MRVDSAKHIAKSKGALGDEESEGSWMATWDKFNEWKAQTVISLMLRLAERGFIRTEKNGKERTYFPIISKEDYLKFETGDFMERFHGNSFASLVATLYDGKKIKDSDLDQLAKWLKERRD